MKIEGDTTGVNAQDQLFCPNGTVDIGMTSKLVVTANPAVRAGHTWVIIQAKSIVSDFELQNETLPAGITSWGPNGSKTGYLLGS
jgi:hypothetical protein